MGDGRAASVDVVQGRARVVAPGFALPAVLRAAYHRTGRFYVAVTVEGEAPVVTLAPRAAPLDDDALLAAAEALARDLPLAELRVQLLEQNRADREYLFARALFGAEAAEQERMLNDIAAAGAGDDPLGIAVPWEEKYGRK